MEYLRTLLDCKAPVEEAAAAGARVDPLDSRPKFCHLASRNLYYCVRTRALRVCSLQLEQPLLKMVSESASEVQKEVVVRSVKWVLHQSSMWSMRHEQRSSKPPRWDRMVGALVLVEGSSVLFHTSIYLFALDLVQAVQNMALELVAMVWQAAVLVARSYAFQSKSVLKSTALA